MADEHRHVADVYESASLMGARLCKRCGSYVSGLHLEAHEELHEQLALNRDSGPAPAPEKEKKKPGKKKRK